MESPALSSGDELIQELIVGITAHALMLAAHVELALQQLLVVSPCKRASQHNAVDYQGKPHQLISQGYLFHFLTRIWAG